MERKGLPWAHKGREKPLRAIIVQGNKRSRSNASLYSQTPCNAGNSMTPYQTLSPRLATIILAKAPLKLSILYSSFTSMTPFHTLLVSFFFFLKNKNWRKKKS